MRREIPADEIVQRCVLAMVNEAARCLEERVLRSARDGDIGAVFELGSPVRGGPFRYVDSVGAPEIVEQLEELNARFPGDSSRPTSYSASRAAERRSIETSSVREPVNGGRLRSSGVRCIRLSRRVSVTTFS